jgi:hypothetical protein
LALCGALIREDDAINREGEVVAVKHSTSDAPIRPVRFNE